MKAIDYLNIVSVLAFLVGAVLDANAGGFRLCMDDILFAAIFMRLGALEWSAE